MFSLLGRYELDEYYDKEVHDSWRLGQYENFEVRWNREPAEYPAPYNRGPVRALACQQSGVYMVLWPSSRVSLLARLLCFNLFIYLTSVIKTNLN